MHHHSSSIYPTSTVVESEACVGNQTLKDKSCLVPCSGLFADIADDLHYQLNRQHMADLVKDLEQSMSKGGQIEFVFSD